MSIGWVTKLTIHMYVYTVFCTTWGMMGEKMLIPKSIRSHVFGMSDVEGTVADPEEGGDGNFPS